MDSAHPELQEAEKADPAWVEQAGVSCCLKLSVSLTTNVKDETSARESAEEGTKPGGGQLGAVLESDKCHEPSWQHTQCDKGCSWLCAAHLSSLGQGGGCGGFPPAPGTRGPGMLLSPQHRLHAWPRAQAEQQVLCEAVPRGVQQSRKEKGLHGISPVQIPTQLAGFQKTFLAAFSALQA